MYVKLNMYSRCPLMEIRCSRGQNISEGIENMQTHNALSYWCSQDVKRCGNIQVSRFGEDLESRPCISVRLMNMYVAQSVVLDTAEVTLAKRHFSLVWFEYHCIQSLVCSSLKVYITIQFSTSENSKIRVCSPVLTSNPSRALHHV